MAVADDLGQAGEEQDASAVDEDSRVEDATNESAVGDEEEGAPEQDRKTAGEQELAEEGAPTASDAPAADAEHDITLTAYGTERGEETVSYIVRSWNGSTVTSASATASAQPVPSDGNMTSGWYYLNSNVNKSDRIESITGNVNLILGDGCTLDVKGIYVPSGSTLTVYAQSDGKSAGRIYSHPSGGAAIGGYSGHDNGNIVIHGGNITATGYDNCAGIGSNDGCTGGAITIYGGTITAKGGSNGAYLQVEDIAAPNLDVMHAFTVTDGTDTYTITASALSYAYTSVKNGNKARQDLGKALYLYNQAANSYFGN